MINLVERKQVEAFVDCMRQESQISLVTKSVIAYYRQALYELGLKSSDDDKDYWGHIGTETTRLTTILDPRNHHCFVKSFLVGVGRKELSMALGVIQKGRGKVISPALEAKTPPTIWVDLLTNEAGVELLFARSENPGNREKLSYIPMAHGIGLWFGEDGLNCAYRVATVNGHKHRIDTGDQRLVLEDSSQYQVALAREELSEAISRVLSNGQRLRPELELAGVKFLLDNPKSS